jgi:hypothetical protein
VQVNHRFVRTTTSEKFDALVSDLREGKRENEIPNHGTLVRVRRSGGLRAQKSEVNTERTDAKAARDQRAEEKA